MTDKASFDLPLLPGQSIPPDERALIEQCHRAGGEGDVDAQTARLFVSAVAQAAPLIEMMQHAVADRSDSAKYRAVIVRGAFWKEHPWTGARGERVVRVAARLGLVTETVETPSLGSLAGNAEIIARHLSGSVDQRRVILVSLSKGSADVKAALATQALTSSMSRVDAWIDLSGTTEGTPAVEQLRRVWWRWLAIRLMLAIRRQPIGALVELRSGNPILATPPALPPGLLHVRVLGFPLRRHLSHPWAQRAFARLEAIGPNDGGGVILRSAIDQSSPPDSIVLPVWGCDHYLRPPWDFDHALASLLSVVCQNRPTTQ